MDDFGMKYVGKENPNISLMMPSKRSITSAPAGTSPSIAASLSNGII
jgi:hypothetical protein